MCNHLSGINGEFSPAVCSAIEFEALPLSIDASEEKSIQIWMLFR